MALLAVEPPSMDVAPAEQPVRRERTERWLVFRYEPVALFSLKMSRATSTAGKTLLIPTPYAIKMAMVDAGLRHGLTDDPEAFVRELARASVRIGVPEHACVTGTIQTVRQETRDVERKRNPELPPYRANIALREFVHYQGVLSVAFDLETCPREVTALLIAAAPGVNYLGKRAGFVQYLDSAYQANLDHHFTEPATSDSARILQGQRAILDDFGKGASFDALNSFNSTPILRGMHRTFVETFVPMRERNSGPGFVHYCVAT